mgnify:CR=1 FL=1
MIMRNEKLAEFLKPGKRVHMVGIGGVSMSALAELSIRTGFRVGGSDRTKTKLTEKLEAAGIVGPQDGKSKNREVLVSSLDELDEILKSVTL